MKITKGLIITALLAVVSIGCKNENKAIKKTSTAKNVLAEENTPIKMYGALQIEGAQLKSECGKPIQLAGMSLFWHQWPGKEFWNEKAFRKLRDDWKLQYLRAPLGIELKGCYIDKPEEGMAQMRTAIEAAIANDIYIIVDWHAHDAHPELAKSFFAEISKDYGKYPNVIYEIFNEPTGRSFTDVDETWPELKAYSQELIATIRENDPDNIIIVPTPFWDQLTDQAADDPINVDANGNEVSNIAYTLHFYAGQHKEDVRDKAEYAIQKGLPIWVTECGRVGTNFGKPRAENANPVDVESFEKWMQWLNKHQISYSKWSLSTKDEMSSSFYKGADPHGNWTGADLTEEGKWNRNHFRERFKNGWSEGCK
ncbi:glycoside hydrolase family 5 protein [Galbibacter mesophilus]|uniref:glycoside hydrolase family 5 protein n=1 Tax=Galbibacter mesophilus TaxID=379069 RepID=UPI00191E75B0|nr:glycoside hydrolase family 5 protein [Galbibacter mesophilus]MCM5663131.1 glycoside hydrolase family 5 protein [Galbibacter mesophilus]